MKETSPRLFQPWDELNTLISSFGLYRSEKAAYDRIIINTLYNTNQIAGAGHPAEVIESVKHDNEDDGLFGRFLLSAPIPHSPLAEEIYDINEDCARLMHLLYIINILNPTENENMAIRFVWYINTKKQLNLSCTVRRQSNGDNQPVNMDIDETDENNPPTALQSVSARNALAITTSQQSVTLRQQLPLDGTRRSQIRRSHSTTTVQNEGLPPHFHSPQILLVGLNKLLVEADLHRCFKVHLEDLLQGSEGQPIWKFDKRDISGDYLSDGNVELIAEKLRTNTHCALLQLSENNITDMGVGYLAEI
ncbi:unnamed protein product [Didymodactylos carnosus]|uniref:Uncharacterized protein n=1 Tax=Didymodactylos carnosus TaxID=1234261 RepID=A0A814TB26_9BILA|nr:unnamed protein product [Didymodactylos carnosus]CAF3922710.1 unnamed protein product [Didymodactylos carnosus]